MAKKTSKPRKKGKESRKRKSLKEATRQNPIILFQDVNTLIRPLFFSGTKLGRPTDRIVLENGKYIIDSTHPTGRIHLFKDVYFEKEDVGIPLLFDAKVLKYLIYKAQEEHDENGLPSQTIVISLEKAARAIMRKNTNIGKKIITDIAKAIVRLNLVKYFYNGNFVIKTEKGEEQITSASIGIVQSYYVPKTPELSMKVVFTNEFYDYILKSSYMKKIDFEVIRKLKSGIAVRLYEVAVSLGEGKFIFSLNHFFDKLGILSNKNDRKNIYNLKRLTVAAAKEVSEETPYLTEVEFWKQEKKHKVTLTISAKEKNVEEKEKEKKNKEEELNLTPEAEKRYLMFLEKKYGNKVNSVVAVNKKMSPGERLFEIEKLKKEIISSIPYILDDIENLSYQLKKAGIIKELPPQIPSDTYTFTKNLSSENINRLVEIEDELKKIREELRKLSEKSKI